MERLHNDEQGLDAQFHQTLSRFDDMDLRGILDQQEELQYRLRLVRTLLKQYKSRHDQRDLFTAIDHAHVVIRRLPASPANKIEMLNSLSWMKMSAFFLSGKTDSRSLIEEAIAYARDAITELTETGINDRMELIKAYDNLGQALSARGQMTGDLKALDEAIDCGRQMVRLCESEDHKAECSANVAIRLHLRYRKTHQEADVSEAFDILTRNIDTLSPNSIGHGASVVARGEIFSNMYKQSGDLDLLDKAIANYVQVCDSISLADDRYIDALRFLGHLHELRYDKTLEIPGLQKAFDCYARAVVEAPNHHTKLDFISRQLNLLHRIADAQTLLPDIEQVLSQAQLLLAQVPPDDAKYNVSANSMSHILARRYLMTRRLVHLQALVGHLLKTGEALNTSAQAMRSRIRLNLKPIQALQACLSKLAERQIEEHLLNMIFQYFSTTHKSSGPTIGVIIMYRDYGADLERLCRPAEVVPSSSSKDKKQTAIRDETQPEKDSSFIQRPRNPLQQSRGPYTDRFTGMRYLAMTPGSSTIIFSMEGITRDLMGYDINEPDPRTRAEFVAREARLEAETLEREMREGKNPNLALCRVCRRIEPLVRSPTHSAISWNTKLRLPHGNWRQLQCRRHCIICNLILSLVAVDPTNPQELHPRLAKIDPEIQGIQFEIQELDTGETILGIRYGLIPVGALRIVSSRNRREALRDGGTSHELGDIHTKAQAWIQNCEINHGNRCSNYLSDKRCQQAIPLIFIDVVNHCLVHATSAEKYFALSYVWGGPQTMASTKSNIESRFQMNSLTEDNCRLAQTIRDAMTLVRLIGERYLWVDSVCIVQDDAEGKDRDIHRMDIVYMMAFAIIAAAHGRNADAGLPGLRSGSRPAQQTAVLSFPSSSNGGEDKAPASDQVLLTTTPGPLLFALESSVWNTRGWVLQEHLLSRRCLFFTSNWVYFQCGHGVISETIMEGRGTVWSGKNKQPQLQENPLTTLAKIGLVTEQQRLYHAFEVYTKLVDL